MQLSTLRIHFTVQDVDAAVAFYTEHLGFHVNDQSGPGITVLERDNLQLALSARKVAAGNAQSTPDGR